MPYISFLYGIAVLLVSYLVRRLVLTQKKSPLPPGPNALPIVGNITDLPPKGGLEWQHWLKHKDCYGPLSSITVLGQTIVLVHDLEIALELLDKRGSKYSSRPRTLFAGEMCGYNELMIFQFYNKTFRHQRKLMARQIGSRAAITGFHSAMELEVRRFLLRTLDKPVDLISHLETESSSLMLAMLYGYTPSPHTPDPLVRLINKVMAEFSKAAVVGAWLVDLIPWLRHLPNWVPGTGFKRTARQWHGDFHEVMNVPINFVTEQKAQEAAKPSYVERLLQQADPISAEEEKKHIRQSAIALYSGGAETTATGLSFFFLAMALFPEVQAKAKEEIDRITGAGRLPSFQDRDRLPYVEAVVKETLRWQVLAPMGAPHVSEEDDEFRGYRIPKGAIILPSIKWFSIDPSVYKDPESLRPERFLGSGAAPSPYDYAFGFGRRICPGQLLAESSLFLTIAQSLAVFDISKAVDKETGRDVKSAVRTTPGFVAHPTPFTCRIIPRSEKCVDFIRRVESEHPWEEGDAKFLKKLSG